jgi:hypothetical protein
MSEAKLIHVRRPLVKLVAQFEPVDPNEPPGTPGPLIHVRRPLVKLVAEQEMSAEFDLVLTLDAGADASEVFTRVSKLLGELDKFARASGGAGLTLDTKQSRAEPGTVTLRLVPADPARKEQQAEAAKERAEEIPGVQDVKLLGV